MKKHKLLRSAFLLAIQFVAVSVSAIDINSIPAADANGRIGASMPYTRYDSEEADLGGGAILKSSSGISMTDIAAQASEHSYISLPKNGSYAEWTAIRSGNGVTMRFTMPDATSGTDGLTGSLDVYVNDKKVKILVNGEEKDNIELSSYWMWQYFDKNIGGTHDHNASDTYIAGATACFAFDEVGFILKDGLKQGDRIRIQSSGANNLEYGVDFLEIEKVTKIECPAGYVAYTGNGSDLQKFFDDNRNGKIYLPAGRYEYGERVFLPDGATITGAGIYYTNIHFTNSVKSGGGLHASNNCNISNLHLTTALNSRQNQNADYKAFYAGGSSQTNDASNFTAHDLWVQHFECGAWFEKCSNILFYNCRLRDNYADGLNFCRGTNDSKVYNCSVRNNGDDGLAMWNVEEEYRDVFCYNTIEFDWRAGGIGIFGGVGHKIYNNLIVHSVYAAGIRVNTDFDGPKFSKTSESPIDFSNNIISCSGANVDIFSGTLPAVDIRGDVEYVNFSNTKIYNSHWQDVRNTTGISFSYTPLSDDPGYPPVDDDETPLATADPLYGIENYDVVLEGLSWQNAKGNTTLTEGDVVTFTAKITNKSSVDIPAKAIVALGISIDGGNYIVVNNRDGLPAGNSVLLSVDWTATAGGHTIKAMADPNEKLPKELSKSNNSSEEKKLNVQEGNVLNPVFTGVTGGYDLVVTHVSFDKSSFTAGNQVCYKAVVTNIGDADVPAGTTIGVLFTLDGDNTNTHWCDTYSGGLSAHQSIELTTNYGNDKNAYWTATNGSHTVDAWVDDQGRFKEEVSTSNNHKTLSFNVPYSVPTIKYFSDDELTPPDNLNGTSEPGPFDGVKDYDLKVTGLAWRNADKKTNDNMESGDEVTFKVRVTNSGTDAIPEGAKVTIKLAIDGVELAAKPTISDGLAINEEKDVTFTWTAKAGGHTVVATAVPEKRLPSETNTDNNSRTKRLNVQGNDIPEREVNREYTPTTNGADLQITDITYYNKTTGESNGSISLNDQIVFTAHIVNAGNAATEDGIKHGVQFQVDGTTLTWNDKHYTSVNPGEFINLQATGGSEGNDGNNYWTPTAAKQYTIMAWVNDTHNLSEDETNNTKTIYLKIPYVAPSQPEMLAKTDPTDPLFEETIAVEVTKVKYATLYYGDYNLIIPTGLKAYTVYVDSNGRLQHGTEWLPNEILPKATAVVLEGQEDSYLLESTDLDGKASTGTSQLYGYDIAQTTALPGGGAAKFYMLSMAKSNPVPSTVGFYFGNGCPNGEAFTSAAHKAFLAVPTGVQAKSAYLFYDTEATTIEHIEVTGAAETPVYHDLQGRRVSAPNRPGIYIVNGRKLVVK